MPTIRLDSPADPRLAEYRNLSDGQLIRGHGLFVAEGRLVVARVLADRRYRVHSVVVTDAASGALAAALSALPAAVPVYLCRTSDLASITGIDFHRGCLALVERPAPTPLAILLAAARTVVVLEAVANPDNVGSVFRNAAAFGVDAVVLSPTCCDPLYRKAIRTSMSATLRVPFARADRWPDAIDQIRRSGLTVAALTPRADAASISPFELMQCSGRVALLVGAEGDGLSAAAAAGADLHVRIPMQPGVDSLNLAVATGIALYALSCGRFATVPSRSPVTRTGQPTAGDSN
jgi:tRNA G18 (ribose-2'-O)-methylase SpoU